MSESVWPGAAMHNTTEFGYTIPPMGQLDLNAALVLVRVVQAGSFRAAAAQLGMPKTSVSRKVAELEEYLGAQLLRRTTRTLSLTVSTHDTGVHSLCLFFLSRTQTRKHTRARTHTHTR